MSGDPYQRLMFAVWTQALSDINKGYLLEKEAFKVGNKKKEKEIMLNAKEAMEWIETAPHTFELVASLHNIPTDMFRDKSLDVIKKNKERINERRQLTTEYMYATVSRFRNYNEAFTRNTNLHITIS